MQKNLYPLPACLEPRGSVTKILFAVSTAAHRVTFRKLLLAMKLTAFLLTVFLTQVHASGFGQAVSFSGEDIPLKKVFSAIRQQTGYTIFFNQEILPDSKRVSLNAEEMPLKDFLALALKYEPVDFQIMDDTKTIVLSRKGEPALIFDRIGIPVEGQVLDKDGNPVTDVSVRILKSNVGTATNKQGRFSFSNVEDGAMIEITAVGFVPLVLKLVNNRFEVVKSGKAEEGESLLVNGSPVALQIKLMIAETKLNEVKVSTGYWTTSQRLSTGNISKVTAKDIETQPVTNPLMALQGRVPGLEVTQRTGVPGVAPQVRIRGNNSIRYDGSGPLYVIDGVIIDSRALESGNGSTMYGGFDPIGNINPANIQSIEVLKDADATSIYGSRGANGVILITTKRGASSGKINVDLQASIGAGGRVGRVELLNREQYMEMRREAYRNENRPPDIYAADFNGHWDTTRYTDWQDELLGGTSQHSNVQLGISGGNQHTTFSAGGNYQRETAIYSNDYGRKSAGAYLNLNHVSPSQKFKGAFTFNYGTGINKLFNDYQFMSLALNLAPVAPPLYDEKGELNWGVMDYGSFKSPTFFNPLAGLRKTHDRTDRTLIINTALEYEVMKGLQVKLNVGYTETNGEEVLKNPIRASPPIYIGPGSTGYATFGNNFRNGWTIEPQLLYAKQFGDHRLDALVAGSWQASAASYRSTYADGYTSDVLLNSLQGATELRIQSDDYSQYKSAALFTRIGYNYKEKYLLNLSARRDGSSRFAPKNRFANFGSVGAAWIISEEPFIRRYSRFLSFAKLRGSYGTTGNDQVQDYQFYDSYGISDGKYDGSVTLSPGSLYNPDFQWEATRKAEVALDLGLLKDRVSLSIVYYNNRSSNQLINYQLPATTGFGSVFRNFEATVGNRGWEMIANLQVIRNPSFTWTVNANITIPRNELVAFPNIATSSYARQYKVGAPLSVWKLYISEGMDPATGLYIIKDLNSDGQISSADEVISDRHRDPIVFGGISNSFRYRQFEFSLFTSFSRKTGNTISYSLPGQMNNYPVEVMQRWQKPGDVTKIPAFATEYNTSAELFFNARNSEAFLEDVTCFRLTNAVLGYRFAPRLLSRLKMTSARIFINGQNLLTYFPGQGFDPDTGSNYLPPVKSMMAGVQIQF